MHSFAQTNGQYQQIGPLQQASQVARHEGTRAMSANNSYQYMTVNSGVQPSQTANFALQNESYVKMQMPANSTKKNLVNGNPLLKMLLVEPEKFLNSQSQNFSLPDSHGSQAATQQNCLYSTIQSLSNVTNPNTTYPCQDMTVPWTQALAVNERQTVKAVDVSHFQQYTTSQSIYQNSNIITTRPLSSYTAAAPSPPQQQMVNANALMSAGSQNVQISQVAPNQFGQNSAEGRFASAYQSSWSGVTSQTFGNRNVSSQTFSNGQVAYVLNQSQIPQQQTTHPCSSYNSNNSRSTNMINHCNSNFSLVKTNEVPLNPAAGSQQMLRHHVSAEWYLPPYEHQHLTISSKMSKQNIQPVTSAHYESYTINPTQSVSPSSGQSLPHQSVMSRGRLTVNPAPQQTQKALPKEYRIDSKQDKRKQKTASDPVPSNRINSKECPVVLPSLSSPVTQKDNASHSVLGHTSTRAVAVVPPLSQEKGNTFSSAAICDFVDPAEKTCITPDLAKGAEATSLREESDLTEVSKVASNLGAVQTTSDSESQISPESPAHKSSTVPASQTCSKEQDETVKSASPPVLDLSSLPTNAWTAEALHNLIMETEQAQPTPEVYSDQNLIVKILIMFWNKNIKTMLQYSKVRQSGSYLNFENLGIDISDKSVILSEVKPDFKDHLKHYCVLKEGEVYLEQPYKSLWLNVNHQLDDIDKEFGFPWCLKQHLWVNETDSQLDPLKTECSIPEPSVNEVHNEVSSPTESDIVDRVEEKASTVDSSPSPPASQNESEDSSSDSDHPFKIEVLPPETAKSIFEQVQNLTPQRTDCENITVLSDALQTGINKDADSTPSSVENKSENKIKEICCLAKFVEMFSTSDVPSKCVCSVEANYNGQTVKTPNPDSESSAKSNKVTDCQTVTLSSSELCSKLEQIIDLTNEDGELDQSSDDLEVDEDQETGILSQISTGNLLNIVIKSESEDNEGSSPDFAMASPPFTLEISETESEDNCPAEEVNSAGGIPTNTSVSSAKHTESDQLFTEVENVLQLSDQGEYCEPAHLKLTEEEESPLESSVKDKPTEKKHRQSSLDQFFPDLKTSKWKAHTDMDFLDVPLAQPQSSVVKTVELVLFGSRQREGLIFGNTKNRPPDLVSVKLDPSRRRSYEPECPKQYSAKHLVYERWRKTFPPNLNASNIKGFRNKLKRQKRPSASQPAISSTHQQPASSELPVPDGLNKNRLSLKRRSLSLIRRHEKIKRRRYSVTLEQPATEEENGTLSRSPDKIPPRENIVLKFSVLPNTFHFPDGSSGTKKTSGSGKHDAENAVLFGRDKKKP